MLYREIIAVCSQIHTKHINTLCGQNAELLNVKLVVHKVTTGLKRAVNVVENGIRIAYASAAGNCERPLHICLCPHLRSQAEGMWEVAYRRHWRFKHSCHLQDGKWISMRISQAVTNFLTESQTINAFEGDSDRFSTSDQQNHPVAFDLILYKTK
jgi:hypothetical protein